MMTVRKHILVIALSAAMLTFFVVVNNESLLKSTEGLRVLDQVSSLSHDRDSRPNTSQLILEKGDVQKSIHDTASIVKVSENLLHSHTNYVETQDEVKYETSVRQVMNVLENKAFESARNFITELIGSIEERNANLKPQSKENEFKNKTQVSVNRNSVSENRNTSPNIRVTQGSLKIRNTSLGVERAREACPGSPKRLELGPTITSPDVTVASTYSPVNPWLQSHEMPVVGELKEPVLVLEAGARVRYNITWHGYTTPVLTFVILGRLGNTMGVYASLWAVARIYDTQVFMEKEVEKLLKPMFPHLTMSPLPVRMVGGTWLYVGRGSPCLADYTSLQEAAAGLRGARAIVVDDYPFEMQIFNAFRDDLLMEFTFSHQLQQEKLFKISPPGLDYLRRALTFYRQRLPRVTFVVASDDQDYVMDALGQELDVVFTQGFPPELDLAVLVACNHTIITMGSFGFWAGYLAGGAVVYPDLQPKMNEYSFSRIFYERANLTQFIPLPP
ncbi:uncharacterized protein [Cherax quadricarinatus]|uniref:uncharacterized protein isoform X2 n=1 Tax=Cherax quadricarinatus TaxID=27406 RepID=UPI00387E45BC